MFTTSFLQCGAVLQPLVDNMDPAALPSIPVSYSTAPITDPEEIKYWVCYKGNDSKRWNGREILSDGNWLESIYQTSE